MLRSRELPQDLIWRCWGPSGGYLGLTGSFERAPTDPTNRLPSLGHDYEEGPVGDRRLGVQMAQGVERPRSKAKTLTMNSTRNDDNNYTVAAIVFKQ